MAASACAIVTPGFNRPKGYNHAARSSCRDGLLGAIAGIIDTGTKIFVGTPISVPSKPAAATPTTVNGLPPSLIGWPITPGRPWNCACQKSCWSTATA